MSSLIVYMKGKLKLAYKIVKLMTNREHAFCHKKKYSLLGIDIAHNDNNKNYKKKTITIELP